MSVIGTVMGRGLFSARPAAGKAGHFFFAIDQGLLYRDNGTSWESYSVPGLVFEFSTTTTDSDPGAGILRFDNGTPGSVTIVRIDDQPHNSDADLSTAWAAISGARLLITQADDPSKYLLGEVTAVADGTGYYNLTVTVDDSGTLIDDGALVSVVILGGGGGGSAASANWWDKQMSPPGWWWHFGNGAYSYSTGGIPITMSGITQDDGMESVSTFAPETEVGCNAFWDATPVATRTGFQIIGALQRAGVGHYALFQVRWAGAGPDPSLMNQAWGWMDNTTIELAPTVNDAGLYFSKWAADTNWHVSYGPGDGSTAWARVDTGVAFDAAAWLNMELELYNDAGTMKARAWINGVKVADITTGLSALATTHDWERLYCDWRIEPTWVLTNDTGFFARSLRWVAGQGVHLTDFA